MVVQNFARAVLSAMRKWKEYCLVLVGNKTELAPGSTGPVVSEAAALDFFDELAVGIPI